MSSIEPLSLPLEAVESKLPDPIKERIDRNDVANAGEAAGAESFHEGGVQGWLNVLGATVSLPFILHAYSDPLRSALTLVRSGL